MVGTCNLDRLSLVGNDEINVAVYRAAFARQMSALFAEDTCKYDNGIVNLFSYVTRLTIPVQLLRTSLQGSIVMLLGSGLPVVVINVLLPFSRWEESRRKGNRKKWTHVLKDSI
jgi:phosphatidylserine/phosphatidylglycerophosphate/cardiolipin synthase-like enzyme